MSKFSRYIPAILATAVFTGVTTNATAAFIESAIGTAVPNDATAVYYNPAALTSIPRKQLVATLFWVPVRLNFTGTATQAATGYSQTGTTTARADYTVPAGYLSVPISNRVSAGFGTLYTNYGITSYPYNSIVRYSGTYSFLSTLDLTPVLALKLNPMLSIGAGLDFEKLMVTLNSMNGAPSLGVPDTLINNEASDWGMGGHVGLLLRPAHGTLIGLTYHSAVKFNPSGQSIFNSTPFFISPNFKFSVTAPPSTVLSVDQFVNPKLGFVGTVQYMQWDKINVLNLQNIATRLAGRNVIVPSTLSIYNLRNTWRFMLGAHYAATKKLTLRGSVAYDQNPRNPLFQVVDGINYIAGVNAGYAVNKALTVDLGYGHTFYIKQTINTPGANRFVGTTDGGKNAFTAKVVWNLG